MVEENRTRRDSRDIGGTSGRFTEFVVEKEGKSVVTRDLVVLVTKGETDSDR